MHEGSEGQWNADTDHTIRQIMFTQESSKHLLNPMRMVDRQTAYNSRQRSSCNAWTRGNGITGCRFPAHFYRCATDTVRMDPIQYGSNEYKNILEVSQYPMMTSRSDDAFRRVVVDYASHAAAIISPLAGLVPRSQSTAAEKLESLVLKQNPSGSSHFPLEIFHDKQGQIIEQTHQIIAFFNRPHQDFGPNKNYRSEWCTLGEESMFRLAFHEGVPLCLDDGTIRPCNVQILYLHSLTDQLVLRELQNTSEIQANTDIIIVTSGAVEREVTMVRDNTTSDPESEMMTAVCSYSTNKLEGNVRSNDYKQPDGTSPLFEYMIICPKQEGVQLVVEKMTDLREKYCGPRGQKGSREENDEQHDEARPPKGKGFRARMDGGFLKNLGIIGGAKPKTKKRRRKHKSKRRKYPYKARRKARQRNKTKHRRKRKSKKISTKN